MKTTIAQERSRFALHQLASIQERMDDSKKDEFAKLASSLPAMILQNGFGHALAFLLAKGSDKNEFQQNDKHFQAFSTIGAWLKERGLLQSSEPNQMVKEISLMSQGNYLRCQEETLFYMEWVKKYANSGLF